MLPVRKEIDKNNSFVKHIAIHGMDALSSAGLRAAIDDESDLQALAPVGSPENQSTGRTARPDVVVAEWVGGSVKFDLLPPSWVDSQDPVPVVALTDGWSPDDALGALRSGVRGLARRADGVSMLVQVIRFVACGQSFFTPSVIDSLIGRLLERLPVGDVCAMGKLSRLTAREVEVLGLLARGQTPAAVAALLSISESTVKSHISHLLDKLDLQDRAQAVVFAFQAGFPSADSPRS
ncbi:hypothetical protein ALI144C_20405 [Actinosynnema sp. ALI-1.44]|uniref:response regulator transcription factor n=1 Tax=Actinosynnema sp. ALI-1.44 TaxID=1933779 RepID=UPI0009C4433D|nr:response regulator transcription factor [Actinosynnema sp. ALI-1.44]ONI81656.1 hypothetical protein ALI144C_20405 [Actinosynnema sp. ALI-1.44]